MEEGEKMAQSIQEQEEILEYIRQGKKQKEIAQIKGVTPFTISKKIKRMDAKKVKLARETAKTPEQEEILEYIRQGKTQEEIAQIKGVCQAIISRRINKIGREKVEEIRKTAKIQEQEEILEYIRQGKKQKEIAQIKGVSQYTISKKVNEIEQDKVQKAREMARIKRVSTYTISIKVDEVEQERREEVKEMDNKREEKKDIERGEGKIEKERMEAINNEKETIDSERNQILELTAQGKNPTEIAEIMGIPRQRVYATKRKIGNVEYEIARQKLKTQTITKADILNYQRHLEKLYDKVTLPEIQLMVRIYTQTSQANKAILFLNSILIDKNMSHLNTEKLKQMEEEVKRVQKIQRARKLIRCNMPTSEIAKCIGISEIEVARLRKQMEEKNGEGR